MEEEKSDMDLPEKTGMLQVCYLPVAANDVPIEIKENSPGMEESPVLSGLLAIQARFEKVGVR